MIPPFNSNGNLPPGIHFCSWEEFVARFGSIQYRLNLIAGLKIAMEQLQTAGCSTIYIDGSFVTNKLIPGDFDACWSGNGVDMNKLISIAPTLIVSVRLKKLNTEENFSLLSRKRMAMKLIF
nr:hypothetical protein [Synechocystis sp. PCC 7509]